MNPDQSPNSVPSPPRPSLAVSDPAAMVDAANAASSPLPWEQLSDTQRIQELLILVSKLSLITECLMAHIEGVDERLQTLELQGVV